MAKSTMAASGQDSAVILMMAAPNNVIEGLRARQQELQEENETIVAQADEEERDLTEEELETIKANKSEMEKVTGQIEAREAAVPQSIGRRTAPEAQNRGEGDGGQRRTIPAAVRTNDPRNGFASFGDFCVAVRQGSRAGSTPDNRLFNAASTYGNEGTGADGGFAVPPEFRRGIWQKVMNEDNLLTRTEQLQTGANSMLVPKDETTPWQTSGGIQVYWEAEGSQATQSKPALEMMQMRLQKLFALVPVSEELLEDAAGLESWLRTKAPGKMVSKINTAIIDGTGAGQPLGLLNAPCTISVAKDSGQAADTIEFENISNMWARMYAPCRRNAVWLINQDIEPQLDALAFPNGGSGTVVPVYLPAGGLSSTPYATLKGRPVIPVEACKTLGDKGDIILADLTQYMTLTKAGQDIRTDVSMHLFFDQALMAFRFIFRINGQPAWGSSITPQNGNNTRSCFVTLDERA